MVLSAQILRAAALAIALTRLAPAQQVRREVWLGFSVDSAPRLKVREVVPVSPAERAGLSSGDAVLMVSGRPGTMQALRGAIAALRPRDSLVLELGRRGARKRVTIIAEERIAIGRDGAVPQLQSVDDVKRAAAGYLNDAARGLAIDCAGVTRPVAVDASQPVSIPVSCFARADSVGATRLRTPDGETIVRGSAFTTAPLLRLGVDVVILTPSLASYFPGTERGVLVVALHTRPLGDTAVLETGDVIVRANATLVNGPGDVMRAGAKRDEPLTLTVVRHGRVRTFTVD